MNTPAALEAALAKAEATRRHAINDLKQAEAVRVQANAVWQLEAAARRKAEAEADRRKTVAASDDRYQDRREVETDRRETDAAIAHSKAVTDRHKAYIGWSEADADWARAVTALNSATAARDKASAALDQLSHTRRKP